MADCSMAVTLDFVRGLPKAELHVHIEGTLEPDLMFRLAARNGVGLPFPDVESVKQAYRFTDLQSFLDIYYRATDVLRTENDFYDLMDEYLRRAIIDGVRRAEIFFDPQAHTSRGIGFETFMSGFRRAIEAHSSDISVGLIMCFLRHLPADQAESTFVRSEPYRDMLLGVGLDSSEVGFPAGPFSGVFRSAASAGLRRVAHAGEEGPAANVWTAIDDLGAERVDHGVRSADDPLLVAELVRRRIPLTMCPLSNVKLKVFERLADHNLRELLDRGVMVTINSDDPAYFGGYVAENYLRTAEALALSPDDVRELAKNSISASFLDEEEKRRLLDG